MCAYFSARFIFCDFLFAIFARLFFWIIIRRGSRRVETTRRIDGVKAGKTVEAEATGLSGFFAIFCRYKQGAGLECHRPHPGGEP
jgi:hypothetical protein